MLSGADIRPADMRERFGRIVMAQAPGEHHAEIWGRRAMTV